MGDTDAPADQLPSGRVTFLFTDIEGSTRLACELGADYRRLLHDHHRLLRMVFDRRAGSEILTEGDSFFVAFQDAETALRAALEAQQALIGHQWPTSSQWTGPARPRVRMGLHTGHAVPDQHGYASSAVHRAARVCGSAHGDQILCSQSTIGDSKSVMEFASTVDLGLHVLRGFDDRERLFQVNPLGDERWVRPRSQSATPRQHDLPSFPDPFIGRENELQQLTGFMKAQRLTTVTSLPGTGRTRLICRAAELAVGSFHDGVWYVPVGHGESADSAIAEAFGVRPDPFRPLTKALVEALESKECLLVLDDVTPSDIRTVETLLRQCRNLKILAAGCSPLKLAGEVKWPLPPINTDDAALILRQIAPIPFTVDDGEADPYKRLAETVDMFLPALHGMAQAVSGLGPPILHVLLQIKAFDVLDGDGRLSSMLDGAFTNLSKAAQKLITEMSQKSSYSVEDLREVFGHNAQSDGLNALLELIDTTMVTTHQKPDGARFKVPVPIRWYLNRLRPWPTLVTSLTTAHEPALHSPSRTLAQNEPTVAVP